MAKFNLHTDRRGNQLIIEGLHRGDNGIRAFEFLFTENGKPFVFPSNCTATFYARLPDGTTLYESPEMGVSSVAYRLCGGIDGSSITSIPGIVSCEIRIISEEGDVLTSPEFSFYIEDVLQDDDAIEASDSFSALTDALGRVIEAETGLDSKVDKVYGTEGNTVIFGKDGSIKDSGGTGKVYVVPFSNDSEKIASIVSVIKADTGNYSAIMEYGGYKVPAIIESGRSTVVSAVFHDPDSQIRKISVTSAGAVTLSTKSININSVENINNDYKAPTGSVVMQYVQEYVAENGGGGADGDEVLYGKAQELSDEEKSQARANIGAGTSDFDGAYDSLTGKPTIPTNTSQLTNDSGYIKDADLETAVDDALTEAKESGEFDGAQGEQGFSILRVTTALSSYTTATGGFTPKYRIALSTVLEQSGASEVRVGDTILRNYYTYPVGYVDSSYVYVGAYSSIRGSAGAEGAAGADGKTAYEYAQDGGYTGTEEEFASKLAETFDTETWTFTLEDGTAVTKKVVLA